MDAQNEEPMVDPIPPESASGSQTTGAAGSPPPASDQDWREQRREARRTMRSGRSYPWIGGVVLILLGVVFMLQNMGINFLQNWWALFILIPAFWSYRTAWNSYQKLGRLTRGGGSSLAWGGLLTLLALVFLFNLDFGLFWPVFLIAGGLILLGMALLPSSGEPPL